MLILDHVVKARDDRGRWATGSGHNVAALTGVAWKVECKRPFGRGATGSARLTVAKDRIGWCRDSGPVTFMMRSDDSGVTTRLVGDVATAPPADGAAETEVLDYVRSHPDCSTRELFAGVKRAKTTVERSRDRLVADGRLTVDRTAPTHRYRLASTPLASIRVASLDMACR